MRAFFGHKTCVIHRGARKTLFVMAMSRSQADLHPIEDWLGNSGKNMLTVKNDTCLQLSNALSAGPGHQSLGHLCNSLLTSFPPEPDWLHVHQSTMPVMCRCAWSSNSSVQRLKWISSASSAFQKLVPS